MIEVVITVIGDKKEYENITFGSLIPIKQQDFLTFEFLEHLQKYCDVVTERKKQAEKEFNPGDRVRISYGNTIDTLNNYGIIISKAGLDDNCYWLALCVDGEIKKEAWNKSYLTLIVK